MCTRNLGDTEVNRLEIFVLKDLKVLMKIILYIWICTSNCTSIKIIN